MKRVLIICVVLLFSTGCAQTRQETMQEEKENLELKQRIDLLSEKLDALDKNIVKLSENVTELADAKWAIAETAKLDTADKEEEKPPVPAAPSEVDILEDSEERGVNGNAPVTETLHKEPAPVQQTLTVELFYNKAYAVYQTGDYRKAIIEFDSFLTAYPDTDYSDNAMYWKGECYYSMSRFADAIDTFEKVVTLHPDKNKAPHAQLKIGFSYIELRDKKNAKNALQKVMDLYPFSDAAKTAANKLNSL